MRRVLAAFALDALAFTGTAAPAPAAPIGPSLASVSTLPAAPVTSSVSTGRLAGSDRIGTAVAISRHAYPDPFAKGGSVYLARSDVFADATAGGTLTDGPILLVPSCGQVPAAVREETSRLRPARVVALGGPGAVCEAMLKGVAGGRATKRLAGADRYATAVAIATERFRQGGVTEVYLASAGDGPDATVGGQLTHGPVLLVPSGDRDPIPAVVTDFVRSHKVRRVVALGGEAVVLWRTLQTLGGGYQRGDKARLAGESRYDTAAAIAYRQFPADVPTVYLARGDVYADAVASGSLTDGPVLLVQRCSLPAVVRERIARNRPTRVIALGGAGAVCPGVLSEAAAASGIGVGRMTLLEDDGTGWGPDGPRPLAAAMSADGSVTAWLRENNAGPSLFVERTSGSSTEFMLPRGDGFSSLAVPWLSMSADGSLVAYSLWALGAADQQPHHNAFVRDLVTGLETRISRRADGGVPTGENVRPRLSADGSTVVFQSSAPDLAVEGPFCAPNVVAYDVASGRTSVVIHGRGGECANGRSAYPQVSADGRYVAMTTAATNVVPGDTDTDLDVVLVDRFTGTQELVNLDGSGQKMRIANFGDYDGVVSLAGTADRLTFAAALGGGSYRVMLRDRRAGTSTAVSVDPSGGPVSSSVGYLAADGRSVLFGKGINHAGQTAQMWYRHDLATGNVEAISLDYAGRSIPGPVWLRGVSPDTRRVVLSTPYGVDFSEEPWRPDVGHLWELLSAR